MQTKRSARSATIFSRVSYAPPPLDHVAAVVDLVGTVDVDRDALDVVAVEHDDAMRRRRCVLFSLLETAPAMRSFIVASASMKQFTVEPVPTPTMLPGCT